MPKVRREREPSLSPAESRDESFNNLGAGAETLDVKRKKPKFVSREERKAGHEAHKRQETDDAAKVAQIHSSLASAEEKPVDHKAEIDKHEEHYLEALDAFEKADLEAEKAKKAFLKKAGTKGGEVTFAEAKQMQELEKVAAHEKKRALLAADMAYKARRKAKEAGAEQEKKEVQHVEQPSVKKIELPTAETVKEAPEPAIVKKEAIKVEQKAVKPTAKKETGDAQFAARQEKARQEYQKLEKQSQNLEDAFRRTYGGELMEASLGVEKLGVVAKLGRGFSDLIRRGAKTLAGEPFKTRGQFVAEYQQLIDQMDDLRTKGFGQDVGTVQEMLPMTSKVRTSAKAEKHRGGASRDVGRAGYTEPVPITEAMEETRLETYSESLKEDAIERTTEALKLAEQASDLQAELSGKRVAPKRMEEIQTQLEKLQKETELLPTSIENDDAYNDNRDALMTTLASARRLFAERQNESKSKPEKAKKTIDAPILTHMEAAPKKKEVKKEETPEITVGAKVELDKEKEQAVKEEAEPFDVYLEKNKDRINQANALLKEENTRALYAVVNGLMTKKKERLVASELGDIDPATEYVLVVGDRQAIINELEVLSKKSKLSASDKRKEEELITKMDALATNLRSANEKLGLPKGLNVDLPFETFQKQSEKRAA